ncbi:hypothetical protein WS69_09615 [Burkholderia sp. BDU5]|nr:hypothetical protein WS69_09615 [Burkholderia sp. BDU5]
MRAQRAATAFVHRSNAAHDARRAAPRNAIARRNSGETFRRAGTAHRAARQGCDDAGLNIAEWQATQCVACGARRRAWRALPIPDITRSDS